MTDSNKPFRFLRSRLHTLLPFLNRRLVSWWVILSLFVLEVIFFSVFAGNTITKLGLLVGCTLATLIIGALLQARRGALLIWFLNSILILCFYLFHPELAIPGWQQMYGAMALASLITGLITGYMRRLALRLRHAYNELAFAHTTIQKQALTDELTGLPNHRAVMEQLHKELEGARRYSRSLSVLFFDADRFKRVNDTYGHAAGDAVLRQIGERAESVLRAGDTIGRFGGEEFVVLLPEADAEEAGSIAERIRASVAAEPVATLQVEGGLAATISIGLSTYLLDGESEQILLLQADEAMYLAKRLGRNQVRTAQEVRQMNADGELVALLQQIEQREATEREGSTPEQLREIYTLRSLDSLMAVQKRRDERLSAHAYAVSDSATAIAQAWGLSQQDTVRIGLAALLHDIGKIAVADRLVSKSTPLSSQESLLLQEHAVIGAQILEACPFLYNLIPAVRSHHERWDGHGYPDHLAGEDIPLAARIIAVAEAYDALQRDSPYQSVRSPQQALEELHNEAGSQFDPAVVNVFSTLLIEQQNLLESAPLVV